MPPRPFVNVSALFARCLPSALAAALRLRWMRALGCFYAEGRQRATAKATQAKRRSQRASRTCYLCPPALVAKSVDAADLKSAAAKVACRFESGPGHHHFDPFDMIRR